MFVVIKLCIPEIEIHHNDADTYIDGDGDDDRVTGCLFLRHPPTGITFSWAPRRKLYSEYITEHNAEYGADVARAKKFSLPILQKAS